MVLRINTDSLLPKVAKRLVVPAGAASDFAVSPTTPTDCGSVLLPYQQRWIADRSRVKVYAKSRRIGVSWADAYESVLTAASKDGCDCWYLGYNQQMAEQYISDCAEWADKLELESERQGAKIFNDKNKDVLIFRIRFASGHKISALSSKPTNLRAKKGRFILDEYAFHQNPEELLKAGLAALMWGGRVAIISTHNGITNHFNQIVEDCVSGNLDYSLHQTNIDDALAEGLYQRICETQGVQWSQEEQDKWRAQLFRDYGHSAEEELMAVPSMGASQSLFDSDGITRNATGQWSNPQSGHYYLVSVDPNFGAIGGDYWVVQVWDITRLPIRLVAEYRDNSHTTVYHRQQTLDLIDRYAPLVTVVEGNSGGKIVAENLAVDRPKLTIETITTGTLTKRVNTDRIALMVQQDGAVYPSDWAGIEEMRKFDRLNRVALSGHDDVVMAWAAAGAVLEEALSLRKPPSRAALVGAPLKTLRK